MKPQLTIPKKGDPYYNTKSSGGYNPCIPGNAQRRVDGLNVLPNCVGWATGRWNAIYHEGLGGSGCQFLGNTNACNFIALAKRQGLEITKEPTLGGCMVWAGGKGGYGHVAIPEIMHNGRVIASESEYYGKAFTLYERSGKNWTDGCYWMGSGWEYLGCIKNPGVEEMTENEVKDLIIEMFPGLFMQALTEYFSGLREQPADEYAEKALKWAKKEGIMIGDATGNQMPQSPVKREDLACVLYGLEQKKNG